MNPPTLVTYVRMELGPFPRRYGPGVLRGLTEIWEKTAEECGGATIHTEADIRDDACYYTIEVGPVPAGEGEALRDQMADAAETLNNAIFTAFMSTPLPPQEYQ